MPNAKYSFPSLSSILSPISFLEHWPFFLFYHYHHHLLSQLHFLSLSFVSLSNGDSGRHWGVCSDQHTECIRVSVGLRFAENTADKRQSLLSQMVHQWREGKPQEQRELGEQIRQSGFQDVLDVLELDASGHEND